MKKGVLFLAAFLVFALPLTVFAGEGPMHLPKGSNEAANMHNEAGIKHWGMGHADEALKHFQEASAEDSSLAEIHFNEAVALDALGRHGEATKHFGVAKKLANGNKAILESPILNGHLGHH
ncbi:MAG: tetratricopeptide repeat protein [Candidatus Nitrohelix vancouverensis]|uniref:Tetratricopeptide repeat protein n=1 Tax=Candidatus Nitrohelix vancouverensis TaxID=2705534 RepID=A0A7T0C383_9BACT|nr:MAG: tetratricopeptide repeat protein [Candidatus Nitrohelix vancouverensis]